MTRGSQPAMTALIAMCSTVHSAHRGAITPTTSPAARPLPAIMARTFSSVGGITGRPSVQPRAWNVSLTASQSGKVSRSPCSGSFIMAVLSLYPLRLSRGPHRAAVKRASHVGPSVSPRRETPHAAFRLPGFPYQALDDLIQRDSGPFGDRVLGFAAKGVPDDGQWQI